MLQIRKKGIKNFEHLYLSFSYIANDLRIESNNNIVRLTKENGAPIFLKDGFNVLDITIYDDTDGGVAETYNNDIDFTNRLIELNYNPYFDGGDVDLTPYALKVNVLQKNNTTVFTPTTDHEPATKKYVDDNAGGENLGNPTVNGQVLSSTTNGVRSWVDKSDKAVSTANTGATVSLRQTTNICNMSSANTNTTIDVATGYVVGDNALILINTANEPQVRVSTSPDVFATKIKGSDFVASIDMQLIIQFLGSNVQYYFLEI